MNTLKDHIFILAQHIVPQHLLSRVTGWFAECEIEPIKNFIIKHFIRIFNVNMEEAAEPDFENYQSFNQFFTRPLKEGARTIAPGNSIASPADGAISELGSIEAQQVLQAKGHYYSLKTLLGGDEALSQTFNDGLFATIYLSPKDYHRVHMPVSGTLLQATYIPGDLFSVNNTTANNVENLFARNERLVSIFDTEHGKMAMILVGAMIVAGIETVWSGQVAPAGKKPLTIYNSEADSVSLQKGEEMGRFKLGSTVVLLFENDKVSFEESLGVYSPVKLGEKLATPK